ncbi:NADH-quinone oxidoreductase subunit NuoF [Butyricicoccus sp.]|uniref:NADH-quinone oxidoreductase subunit NuoF n=1 Tax=Butyricicoccus sp. TaxID=2049021 RepID=UPI003F177BCC
MEEMKVLLRNRGKIDPISASEYRATGGYEALRRALEMDGAEIIEELKRSGLRGRGGAGFPTYRKMEFAYQAPGEVKYIVCNADEGEPGTNKDRILLSTDPCAIFEGMAIAGKAVNAHTGFIYLRAEYSYLMPILEAAIESSVRENCLGKDILGSGFDFEIKLRSGAGAYVCGEETALFESIEGRRGEPRFRPPFPGFKGLFGKPTVLNNVETLANIPPIFRHGADWYRSIGTETSPGTKLFTVCGNAAKRGVFEFPMGINLKELIYDVCGGVEDGRQLLAVQTGGASGAIINADQIDMKLDIDSVSASGGRLGCGTILVIDDRNCIIDIVRNNLDFFRDESCGKCTPCREGGTRLYQLISKIAKGKGGIRDLDTIMDLAETMRLTALCGLGHSTAVPVTTSIQNFRSAYLSHIDKDYCPICSQTGGEYYDSFDD